MRDAELQILLETLGTDDATARVITQLFERAAQVEDLIRERGDLARQCERAITERDELKARAKAEEEHAAAWRKDAETARREWGQTLARLAQAETRVEQLSAASEFSCERSPEDCECPGCTLANSYEGDVDRLLADRAALADTTGREG